MANKKKKVANQKKKGPEEGTQQGPNSPPGVNTDKANRTSLKKLSEAIKTLQKMGSSSFVSKKGGGMTRVGLSPAEEARSGTMSEAKRVRYRKPGGKVGKKKQGYTARKNESISMRVKKPRTKEQLTASRDESYGKFGSGKGKGKINKKSVSSKETDGNKVVAACYG